MSSSTDELKEKLIGLGYKVVPDYKVGYATHLILTETEFLKLSSTLASLITASQNHLLDMVDDGVKDKQTYSDWDSESYKDGYNEANAAWHAHIAEVRGKL